MICEGNFLVGCHSSIGFDAWVSQVVLHFDDLKQYLTIAFRNVVSDVVDSLKHHFTLLSSHFLHWYIKLLLLSLLGLFLSLLLLLTQEIQIFSESCLVKLQCLLEHLLSSMMIDNLEQVLMMIVCKYFTSMRLEPLNFFAGYFLEVVKDRDEAAIDILDCHLLSILISVLYEII